MVRDLPRECDNDCPVYYGNDGSTSSGALGERNYVGPSIQSLFVAMSAVGYVAMVRNDPIAADYIPTALGIEYLEKFRHPTKFGSRETGSQRL